MLEEIDLTYSKASSPMFSSLIDNGALPSALRRTHFCPVATIVTARTVSILPEGAVHYRAKNLNFIAKFCNVKLVKLML